MNHEAEKKFLGMLVLSRFNNYFKRNKLREFSKRFLLFNFFFHYACVNVCNLAFSSPFSSGIKDCAALILFFFFFFPVKLLVHDLMFTLKCDIIQGNSDILLTVLFEERH